MIAVYIPCKDENEAGDIAKKLLEKKLVACAGMWPIRSLYTWKGEIADESETVILAKSTKENYQEIKTEVKKNHSYETPAIIKFNIESNKDYEKWLRQEVSQQPR